MEKNRIFNQLLLKFQIFLLFEINRILHMQRKYLNFWRYDVGMDKKFKEVRNVLNMKNIIGAGIVMGTLFVSTSAFAAEQNQETTK